VLVLVLGLGSVGWVRRVGVLGLLGAEDARCDGRAQRGAEQLRGLGPALGELETPLLHVPGQGSGSGSR
jgi:hypothetical protein